MKINFKRGHLFDWRVWALLIPAIGILARDLPILMTLIYSLSAMLVVVAVTHIIRRILFHYIDMDELAARASDTATGAAIVFLGVCMVIAAVVIASALWIAK